MFKVLGDKLGTIHQGLHIAANIEDLGGFSFFVFVFRVVQTLFTVPPCSFYTMQPEGEVGFGQCGLSSRKSSRITQGTQNTTVWCTRGRFHEATAGRVRLRSASGFMCACTRSMHAFCLLFMKAARSARRRLHKLVSSALHA